MGMAACRLFISLNKADVVLLVAITASGYLVNQCLERPVAIELSSKHVNES